MSSGDRCSVGETQSKTNDVSLLPGQGNSFTGTSLHGNTGHTRLAQPFDVFGVGLDVKLLSCSGFEEGDGRLAGENRSQMGGNRLHFGQGKLTT
jgi:hypothetical protein